MTNHGAVVVADTIPNVVGRSIYMFRSRRQTPKGSQTRLYVETQDAMAGMLIANNDQPLSVQEHQAEINHLNWLAGNPEQLKKKHGVSC